MKPTGSRRDQCKRPKSNMSKTQGKCGFLQETDATEAELAEWYTDPMRKLATLRTRGRRSKGHLSSEGQLPSIDPWEGALQSLLLNIWRDKEIESIILEQDILEWICKRAKQKIWKWKMLIEKFSKSSGWVKSQSTPCMGCTRELRGVLPCSPDTRTNPCLSGRGTSWSPVRFRGGAS